MHGIDILIEFYIQWDKKVNLKKIGRSFQLPKSNDKTPKNLYVYSLGGQMLDFQ